MLNLELLSVLGFVLDLAVIKLPSISMVSLAAELLRQVESLAFIHLTLCHLLAMLLLMLLFGDDSILGLVVHVGLILDFILYVDLRDHLLLAAHRIDRLMIHDRSRQLNGLHEVDSLFMQISLCVMK